MARAATTSDAFNAVAEARRRQILDALAAGERAVGDLVAELELAQPQVSKHLRVLREAGLVAVREVGRQRLYRLNADALKPIHDWISGYAELWSERFEALDAVLADLQAGTGLPDNTELQAGTGLPDNTELQAQQEQAVNPGNPVNPEHEEQP